MATERLPITWNDRLVGWIESPGIDMPHFYGRWLAADSADAVEFLAELRRAVDAGEGLEVIVSTDLPSILYVHPDDEEGKFDVRWIWR